MNNILGKDLIIEILARLGPGKDAIRALKVCRSWEAYLRTEWCYLRMIQCCGLPRNRDIFGEGEGLDPNHWKGYQRELASVWSREVERLRASIVECQTAVQLVRAMYCKGVSKKMLLAAIDHYRRFDHAPLWTIAGDTTLDEKEQADMCKVLLYAKANVDLTGGSGVRTTPLQQAVRAGRPAVISILLLGGAVVDKFGGSFQQTPLVLAAGECGNAVITQRLVAAGADLAAEDEDGFLAMHRAISLHRLEVLNYFAELLRWKLVGKGLSQGMMTRPVMLSFSIFSSRLPDPQKCCELIASVDWLEGLLFMRDQVGIPQAAIVNYAMEACEGSSYSCKTLLQWLWKERAIDERNPRLFEILSSDNLPLASLACLPSSGAKWETLLKIFCRRSWSTLQSLYTLGWIEPREVVLLYLRHLLGRKPWLLERQQRWGQPDLGSDFYEGTIASLFEWESIMNRDKRDLKCCVDRKEIDVGSQTMGDLHDSGWGLRSVNRERVNGVPAQLKALKMPLEGREFLQALLQNDHVRGKEMFFMVWVVVLSFFTFFLLTNSAHTVGVHCLSWC